MPGAAHSNLTEFADYRDGVLRFLEAHLGGAPQPATPLCPSVPSATYPRENPK